jgi:hypothetical protein
MVKQAYLAALVWSLARYIYIRPTLRKVTGKQKRIVVRALPGAPETDSDHHSRYKM